VGDDQWDQVSGLCSASDQADQWSYDVLRIWIFYFRSPSAHWDPSVILRYSGLALPHRREGAPGVDPLVEWYLNEKLRENGRDYLCTGAISRYRDSGQD
jgi:hypothetical protein